MYASEESSKLSKILEISTWVLLFLALVPGTALGYFAEQSLPNSPLYPVKRDIEHVVLALVSVNTSAKSFYQLNLADTRVQEVHTLFASNNAITSSDIGQLDIAANQLTETNTSIQSVKDPVQKAQMKAALQTTVTKYQQQLVELRQQILVTQTTTITASTPSTTPTEANPSPTQEITPAPNVASLTTDQQQQLQDTIQQVSQQLTDIQQNLQQDTTTPPPTPTITTTPVPVFFHHRGDHTEQQKQKK